MSKCISSHAGDCCDCCPIAKGIEAERDKLQDHMIQVMDQRDALKAELERFKSLALKAKEKLEEMAHISYFEDAEGPELRAQNASLHRLAKQALADFENKRGTEMESSFDVCPNCGTRRETHPIPTCKKFDPRREK